MRPPLFICALVLLLAANTARATNWHCYYTNCLFVFVPQVVQGATVTTARVELEYLCRAERYGAVTNTTVAGRSTQPLAPCRGGFGAYVYFGAQQHRLWEPFDAGVIIATLAQCGTNATQQFARNVVYYQQHDGIVRACGPPSLADRVEERAANAARQLQQTVRQHTQQTVRTNAVLFIAQWGYVS